jgi:hypothetical protein
MARLGVIIVVAVLLVTAACGSGNRREDLSGLQLSSPKSWTVHRLGVYCRGRVGPGLLITNIPKHTFTHDVAPGECTNAWKVNDLPDKFILIDISRFNARPAFDLSTHPRLPISESDLRQTVFPRLRAFNFWRNNRQFNIRVWTGRQVSSGDRAKVAALIKSIRSN